MNDIKQVIVVRKDLNMRKGKLAAQAAHAALGSILSRCDIQEFDENGNYAQSLNLAGGDPLAEWLRGRFTKIVVYVESEAELFAVHAAAQRKGIHAYLVQDAGRTEFDGVPTYTCIALGPDYSEKIDAVTGHLKLL